MSSTTATTSAPKPVEATARPAQAGARAAKDKTETGDIFSSLLSLLASTRVEPEVNVATAAAAEDSGLDDHQNPDGNNDPLAALMGWGLPGATDSPLRGQAGALADAGELALPRAAGTADRATTGTAEGKLDITGMTPVEPTPLELTPKGAVALPANALRPGAPPAALARAADATSGVVAPQWRHASLASTETLAIQQTMNPAAQVRSTVALNDRFGATPGVPLAAPSVRDAAPEGFSLPAAASAASRAPESASALPSAVAGEGAAGPDNTGSDASAFDQSDAQADNPYADANAGEEHTVTHWGTQHLRHASLRVGGEVGEQAIDIQLSMKGQEVQVEFKTDSAEARASLRESAGESLADLLNKSGIQLGGVSVGAQGQPGGQGEGASHRQNGARALASAQEAAQPTTTAARPATRADGSQPLDVFA
jgi:hypothetical protein